MIPAVPRRVGTLALVIMIVALPMGTSLSGHRRDEYLQAARLAIDPERVQIALDLTPGIVVAERVLSEIDLDRDKSISDGEAQAYCTRLLSEVTVDVDSRPVVLELTARSFPGVDAMLNGEGTMRLQAAAATPRLSAGLHQLRYRNSHRSDIGVYLVNALVPSSDRVAVASQRRDADQRDVTIEYELRADSATRLRGGLAVAFAGALIWLTTWLWRRRREPSTE